MKIIICWIFGHDFKKWNNFMCEKEQCERCDHLKWIRIKTNEETFQRERYE